MNDYLESPCPGSKSSSRCGQFALHDAWEDDTIDTLEYTAAINFPPRPPATSLAKAKPRRVQKAASFTIKEDPQPSTTSIAPQTTKKAGLKRKPQDRSSSILAQPAQRFQRPRISSANVQNNETLPLKRSINGCKTSDVLSENLQPADRTNLNQKVSGDDSFKKDVRRRTVYIPTEDTTIPAVFMSLFSPVKSTDASKNISSSVDETVPLYSLEARIAAKTQSRTSAANKPGQVPLQPSKKIGQTTATNRDVMGKNGGKENIPPGYFVGKHKEIRTKEPLYISQARSRQSKGLAIEALQSSRTNNGQMKRNEMPKFGSLGQKSSTTLLSDSKSKVADPSLPQKITNKHTCTKKSSLLSSNVSKESLMAENFSAKPTQLSLPKVFAVDIDQRYPVISADILNPTMYEDDWLSHQEIVITQLVNGLFDSVGGKLHIQDSEALRHELLHVYQSDEFLLLYKRLQASILYGSLSPSKDILCRGSRLPDDLGMKRSFLNYWTETYDLSALKAAAETVIGRKINYQPVRTGNCSSDLLAKQRKTLKRAIEIFLETFLIRNMDRQDRGDRHGEVVEGQYQRTILRSIMIIVLLDKARLTPGNSLPRRLFTDRSPYKSSSSALQALAHLLLPSMGDLNRHISHLNCSLLYKQHQLQDYEFRIQNLAVDLRDGILLTRLTEILLYPISSHSYSEGANSEITAIDQSLFRDENSEWPLSQNLKIPCPSKAAKIFNVQIALDALKGAPGIDAAIKEIDAEHIVDGYREKTLALLWVLVGKWGLAGMLDWNDVRSETVRLQKKLSGHQQHQSRNMEILSSFELGRHEDLLIKWASSLAQLKGLQLDNLTTSFADGKIFESIVDEYEVYLLKPMDIPEKQPKAEQGLQSRLLALGCSSQFASLVARSTSASHIFDRDFVLGALTFLCSRLLSSTRRIRAAIVIQKAWRRITTEANARRRVVAKEIAEQCAAVVCARNRVLWAKGVIVKWWRDRKKQTARTVASRGKRLTAKKSMRRMRL